MADPDLRVLTVLRRVRHVETDGARRDLGLALRQETALAEREAAIGRELEKARQISGDFDREAFSAWYQRIGVERTWLANAMREAQESTAEARITLAHRRVAETAAEEALAGAVTAREAAAGRREQVMLEDVARALKRADRGSG